MGKTRYYYNKKGQLTGTSTDTPPGVGCGCMIIAALVLVFLMKAC